MLYTNVLATDFMAATWQGKLITKDQYGLMAVAPRQARVDYYIENNMTFGQTSISDDTRYQIGQLRFEDGSPVTPDDCIDYSQVPSDAELFIGLEPKFYLASS